MQTIITTFDSLEGQVIFGRFFLIKITKDLKKEIENLKNA